MHVQYLEVHVHVPFRCYVVYSVNLPCACEALLQMVCFLQWQFTLKGSSRVCVCTVCSVCVCVCVFVCVCVGGGMCVRVSSCMPFCSAAMAVSKYLYTTCIENRDHCAYTITGDLYNYIGRIWLYECTTGMPFVKTIVKEKQCALSFSRIQIDSGRTLMYAIYNACI